MSPTKQAAGEWRTSCEIMIEGARGAGARRRRHAADLHQHHAQARRTRSRRRSRSRSSISPTSPPQRSRQTPSRRPLLLGDRASPWKSRSIAAACWSSTASTSIRPEPRKSAHVHDIIYRELCRGVVEPASKARCLTIIEAARERGADGVILGCTRTRPCCSPQADSRPAGVRHHGAPCRRPRSSCALSGTRYGRIRRGRTDARQLPPLALGKAIRHEWALDWSQAHRQSRRLRRDAEGGAGGTRPSGATGWRRSRASSCAASCPKALRTSANALAAFLNAVDGQDVTFVDNATTGCNAVLRSLELKPGDEILMHSQAYGAVANTARCRAERSGARVSSAAPRLPEDRSRGASPAASPALLDCADPDRHHRPCHLAERAGAADRRDRPRLPRGGRAAAGRRRPWPGTGRDRSQRRIDADWLCRQLPRMAGGAEGAMRFLWARRDRRDGLHPTTISHGFGGGYLCRVRLDRHARCDADRLAIEPALAFHEQLGGR